MSSIKIDPLAEDNGLAIMIGGLLSENIAAHYDKARALDAMSTSFAVVAPDADTAVTITICCGKCRIYNGHRPEAEVVITADAEKIPSLSLLQIRYGLPWILDNTGKDLIRALLLRDIKISGLVDLPRPHPLTTLRRALDLVRLTKILSVNG